MKKMLLSTFLALTFLAVSAGTGIAKFNCTVESIKDGRMVIKNCDDDKQLGKLKAGSTISITKKRQKLEGC